MSVVADALHWLTKLEREAVHEANEVDFQQSGVCRSRRRPGAHSCIAPVPLVLASAVFWKLCFHVTGSMHIIASFHAVVVAALASWNIYLGPHQDLEAPLYIIMAGYFIADYFTYCIRHDPIVYGFHHMVTGVFSNLILRLTLFPVDQNLSLNVQCWPRIE